jgi:hypothetical protein
MRVDTILFRDRMQCDECILSGAELSVHFEFVAANVLYKRLLIEHVDGSWFQGLSLRIGKKGERTNSRGRFIIQKIFGFENFGT